MAKATGQQLLTLKGHHMSFIKIPNILFDYYEIECENACGQRKKLQKIKYYDLEPVDFRVYVYFLSCGGFVNQKRIVRKYKTIAAHCGVKDPKTVQTSVDRMINIGLLTKSRRFNNWGHFAANGYQVAALPGGFFMFDTQYFRHEMSVAEMCVLLYLNRCRNADDPRFSCPSVSKMCFVLNLAKATVRKSIHWLSQRFYIQKNYYISKKGDFGNNRYRLYTSSERNELLRPFRKIVKKAPGFLKSVVRCLKNIGQRATSLLGLHICTYLLKHMRVGQSFPNTS